MKRASQRHLPLYMNQVSITALLDLVLVLLLGFLVAVPLLRREKAVEKTAAVPAPEVREKVPAFKVTLSILPDQVLLLDGEKVTGEKLMPEIRQRLAKKPEMAVLVKMPSNFAAGSLARLMEEMHRAGVRQTAVEVVESPKP